MRQVGGVLFGQRGQPETDGGIGGGHEAVVLGPSGGAHEPQSGAGRGCQAVQHPGGRLVHPVHVFEDEERGCGQPPGENLAHHLAQLDGPELDLHVGDLGGVVHRDADDGAHERGPGQQGGVEGGELRAQGGGAPVPGVGLVEAEERPHQSP